MTSIKDDRSSPRPPEPGLLADWLHAAGVACTAPLSVSLIAGGRSNLTYAITDADGQRLVLRRPPGGELLASAHDMGREWRFIAALHPTDVPVPEPKVNCEDPSLIGAPFYVMSFVDGVVVDTGEVAGSLPESVRQSLGADLITTMTRLHAIEPADVGLADIAKGADYLGRQLRRWQRQWELSAGPASVTEPLMDTVHADLVRLAPPQLRTGIVHGDFRLGNMISGRDGTIRAILDWELATLGDPLADLGYLLTTWATPEDGPDPSNSPSSIGGFQSRTEMIDLYADKSGVDPGKVDYYVAFNYWRVAAILAGVSARYQAGTMGDDGTDTAAYAREQAERISFSARSARALLDSLG
ncbi:MAG TPA: phosphotransferase family protein [Pseudonocardia sp.]|nr:phosphotransferase family protein [Pseudonocardia sp.]